MEKNYRIYTEDELEIKNNLKKTLLETTLCDLQHDGWPCGTCFFKISPTADLTNEHWQTVLWIRGDYVAKELDNISKNIEVCVEEIFAACKARSLEKE